MSDKKADSGLGRATEQNTPASDVMLRLLDDFCQPQITAPVPGLSRRAFIAASGGVASLAAAAVTPSSLLSIPAGAPVFVKSGRILTGKYLGHDWVIDEARFGASANANYDYRQDALFVWLKNASMPGTSRTMDFEARIWNTGNAWRIKIDLAGQRSDAELGNSEWPTLLSWFSGKQVIQYRQHGKLTVGDAVVSHAKKADLFIELDKALLPRVVAPLVVKMSGLQFSAAGMVLADGPPSSLLGAFVPTKGLITTTTVNFDGAALPRSGIRIAKMASGQVLNLTSAKPQLRLEAYSAQRSNDALIIVGGEGAFELSGSGLPDRGASLQLKKSVLVALTSSMPSRLSLAYTVSRKPFVVETSSGNVQFMGDGLPAVEHIRNQTRESWPFALQILRAWLPVRGASFAAVDFAATGCELLIGPGPRSKASADTMTDKALKAEVNVPSDETQPQSSPAKPVCNAWLRIGRETELDVPLEDASLNLKRSADLFDMRFEFRNYRLVSSRGGVSLRRRWSYEDGCEVALNWPTLIAVFPPQHEQEEVFTRPLTMPGQAPIPKPRKPDIGSRPLDTLAAPHDLARTIVAAPTRIALRSQPRIGGGLVPGPDVFELTIESITDWHDLALVVHERALPNDASLDAQLAASGLTPQTTRQDARNTLFSRLKAPPSRDVTTLEVVTGLVVSPDSSARFDVPRAVPSANAANAVWSARLKLDEQSAVRAIHARGASLDFLSDRCAVPKELENFYTSLNVSDRSELVLLMSAYGLPSLRRLQRDADNGEIFKDDPLGMVIRPAQRLSFLSDDTVEYQVPASDGTVKPGVKVKQEGILLPRPYAEFDLTLTSLKANLRSRWSGEPPAPLASDPFFARALNIEGYIHRTAGGRDALVQVAYKGFLFPLGHRAALIKVSERPFLPARWNADYLEPTAYLVQRSFIVCRKPVKAFPALGQPDLGRAFHAANVEIVTTITPDILNVDDKTYEREKLFLESPDIPGKKRTQTGPTCTAGPDRPDPPIGAGRVFWPRTRPGIADKGPNRYGNEVMFDWKIDGSPDLVRSPLIFADNAAVHDPQTMESLVRYYDSLDFDSPLEARPEDAYSQARRTLRIAAMSGVERKYAPALKAGQTSFSTNRWILGASGGIGADSLPTPPPQGLISKLKALPPFKASPTEEVPESFTMDALMEGADQPPFYPRMHRAFINMQPLDRMLGKPQGVIEVGFSRQYVDFGMDKSRNPSEIYLNVLRPAIDLDVSDQGRSSGGLAKPNARLAAVGRVTTMIGGRPLPQASLPARIATQTRQIRSGVSERDITFDTRAAQAGQFDVTEFFGGALSEARLLGIIPLREVVKVVAMGLAPKLQESVQYATEGMTDTVKEAAVAIVIGIDTATSRGNALALKALNLTQGDPLGDFYPSLAARLRALRDVCARIESLTPAQLEAQFQTLAGQLISSGKDVIESLEELAANPLPEGLADFLEQIRTAQAALKELATPEGVRNFIVGRLKQEARKEVESILRALAKPRTASSGNNSDIPPDSAFDVLFGIGAHGDAAKLPQTLAMRETIIQEILDRPSDAADRLKRGLFSEVFGQLLAAWAKAAELEAPLNGLLILSRQALTQEIAECIARGNAELAQLAAVQKQALVIWGRIDAALAKFNVREVLKSGSPEAAAKDLIASLKDAALEEIDKALVPIYKEIESAKTFARSKFQEKIKDLEKTVVDGALAAAEREEAQAKLLDLYADLKRAEEIIAIVKATPAIGQRVIDAVHAEVIRQLEAYAQTLKAEAEDFLGRAIGQATNAAQGILTAAGKAAALLRDRALNATLEWCEQNTRATDAATLLNAVADLLIKGDKPLKDALSDATQVRDGLVVIELPRDLPPEIRADLQSRLSTMRRSTTQVVDGLTRLHEDSVSLRKQLADPCSALGKAVDALAANFETRQRVLLATLEASLEMARWTANATVASAKIASGQRIRSVNSPAIIPDVCGRLTALTDTLRKLIAFEDQAFDANVIKPLTELDKALGRTPSISAESLAGIATAVKDGMTKLSAEVAKAAALCVANDQKARELVTLLEGLRSGLTLHMERLERKLAGAIAQALVSQLMPDDAFEVVQASVVKLVGAVNPVLKFYDQLVVKGGGSIGILLNALRTPGANTPYAELLAVVGRPGIEALTRAKSRLLDDHRTLSDIRQTSENGGKAPDLTKLADQITKLTEDWSSPKKPGIVDAVEIFSRLVQSLLKGQFSAFFDLNALRDEVRNQVLSLLPTKLKQSYAWDTRLEDYPSGDPIFKMDRSRDAVPPLKNDLVLTAEIDVDLVKKTRIAKSKGEMRPFNIRLLGERLDLVTLKFKGASFSASTGEAPTYSADIEGVEIGAMLEFIKALQQFFSPGEGNGPYVALQLFPPEIQAGYRYSAPFIPVGSLMVMNVAIAVSMNLPFDNRQAYFKFAFASRDLPFLISQPPYGGGGFVGLMATAKGIIGFEIQFEFGAVVGIKFGPLQAQGRVTAGIYLLSSKEMQVLEGFVTAVGEGNIACFGISVNIAVRVRQVNGGAMVGSSRYSFSFKVGFASISYSFTAQYNIQGGSDKGSNAQRAVMAAAYNGKALLKSPGIPLQVIRTAVPLKERDWASYRKHFSI
jgi:hypothetical protein